MNEKKLTLEHLAGYLHYGLRCEILNYKNDYIGEKYGMIEGFYYYAGEPHFNFKNRDFAGKDTSLFKPILHPLSDLTKEIEVNGEKFVPIDVLYPLFNKKLTTGLSSYGMQKKIELHPLHMPYFIIQKLLSWHFDIHGLINDNLAIDINTLKNE